MDIRLEYENAYDWLAFVPMRDSEAGALTKYFGSVTGADEYTYRGIECRQRSTPPFVSDAQRDLVETFDTHRDPGRVCERLQYWLRQLRAGTVDPASLLIDNRVSKSVDEYTRLTRNVAALERADRLGFEHAPEETVSYVVVDDGYATADRVRLASEDAARYDTEFYTDLLVRAAESVLSPCGWRRERITRALDGTTELTLDAF